jgi:MYXO-CTERM domain-containing protein
MYRSLMRDPVRKLLSALFVLAVGACGNFGGCGACGAVQPLPGGQLPPDQTVEGGAQIRVTQAGFTKLTSILPGALNQSLSGGFCMPRGTFGSPTSTFGTGAEWCYTNANGCNPGCKANVSINPGGLALNVTNQQTLHLHVSTSLSMPFKLRGQLVGVSLGSCTMTVTSSDLSADMDIALGIKPADGELDIHVANINSVQLNMDFQGCGILSSIGNLAGAIIDSFVGQFIVQLLTPAIDNLIQGFLPNPLGVKGMIDVGKLLQGVSPGTEALMEGRIVPGGYVALKGNGMSLGVITGFNADVDPSTRTGIRPDGLPFASEPSRCVPPMMPPNFGAPPANLPITSRSTFRLDAAGAFDGAPDPNADLAMGMSETSLDQLGQHMVTSGAMCLGVGTSFIAQLNVGTIGLLVPSLSELTDTGKEPLLLVTRPQRAIDFKIGDNTATSPAVTIALSHMEVDFYAFLFERYVRAFTLDLTMNIGINLEFDQQPGMPAMIKPTLVGISADSVTVKVLNSQFVRETPQKLEMVLPSVFDLVTPLLGNIPPIQVPSFAGFSLNNLSIQHVVTPQDDFLGLYATLGAGAFARQLGQKQPLAAAAVDALDRALPPAQPMSKGTSHLAKVDAPPAETVRAALMHETGGRMPTVTFDVDRYDSLGRELEWSWNLNGGMWRPFVSGSPLVIADRALAWQGKYKVGLVSRVKGDYRTTSQPTETPVVIDSVGPKVLTDKGKWDDDVFVVPAVDLVSDEVMIAYGHPGDEQPVTNWVTLEKSGIARDEANVLAIDGEIAVFAKDEQGNMTIALVAPFHGQSGTTGCGCQSSGRPTAGGLALVGLVAFGLFRRRRRVSRFARVASTLGLWVGASAVMSLQPGCSCSDKRAAQSCEMTSDCSPAACDKGQLPFCVDNTCVCSDDIVPGRIGPYSDVAAGPDGSIWVSAYASSHGDLVVAKAAGGRIPDEDWEWVDGIPDGPVVVPGSKIRGGIDEAGPDVGMYTSIAVAPDGTPMVTYFDRDMAALKFAAKVNGEWQIHVVDAGTGQIDPNGGSLVGMYTSLSLRTDDGRPGVAYLAHVSDGNGERAEVRYAAAQTALPKTSADWQTWVVDTAPLPAVDPAHPDVYPLPEGLGLFIDSTRDPRNQAPVVTYYDRAAGDLKLSRFDVQTGQFGAPKLLDGSGNVDAGWSPTVAVDPAGVAHVAYVSATGDDLKYITDAPNAKREIIDDGYRIVGTTVDGLPKPEFHFVGDDAGLVLPMGAGDIVVYQDATTQELLVAQRQMTGEWTHVSIAGATTPYPGAYGFFASAALRPQDVVISTWVIDQQTSENWVEVMTRSTVIQ